MNLDFEDQLKADLAAVEATPRPGLVQRAFREHRAHQKARRRVTLAAVGCAAAVAGVATGLSLTSASPSRATPQATASLIDDVTSALNSTTAISYAATTGVETTRLMETWSYGNQLRWRDFSASTGKPVVDYSSVTTATERSVLTVDYPARTWYTSTSAGAVPGRPPEECGSFALAESLTATQGQNWRTVIATALKCSTVTVIGHQEIGGIPAIELRTRSEVGPVPPKPGAYALAVDTTLWIDASTYLPIRSVNRETDTTVSGKTGKVTTTRAPAITTTYRWLPPTKSNLADLLVPVPAGFKEVKF